MTGGEPDRVRSPTGPSDADVTAAPLTATVESTGRSTPRAWTYLRRNPSFWIGLIDVVHPRIRV